jgi:peptidyl-prolyl cis-trans isomerase A (cyclophilin A)
MNVGTALRSTLGVAVLGLGFLACSPRTEKTHPRPDALDESTSERTPESRPESTPESQPETEPGPDSYQVRFETTKGEFVVEVTRAWAPNGADRFYELVNNGFYDETRFFRVLPGFVVQWGISGNPEASAIWRDASIPDDPVEESNTAGTVSYAMRGPGTRTTQVFINLVDNSASLDARGFAPFGRVTEGMEIVEQLYAGYGEGPPDGSGPYQERLLEEGNAYLEEFFGDLDYVKKASVIP